MMRLEVIVSLFVLTVCVANANGVKHSDSLRSKYSPRTIVLPAVFRSPETKWAGGAAISFTFRPSRSDTVSRKSSIQALGLYTQRRQKILGIESTIFFREENHIFRFHGSLSAYPDRFWGLGNNSLHHQWEQFEYEQYYIFPQFLKRMYKKLYVGVTAEYQKVTRFNYKPNGLFTDQNVVGRNGGVISGGGGLLTWDDRDNAFSPEHGQFLEFAATSFSARTASNFQYINYALDARKYVLLQPGQVLAFQLYGNFNKGTVPFLSLASLGGGMIMRGYYNGRFRDHNLVALQSEYRLHVWRRWGAVAFAGFGQVGNRVNKFATYQFKYAVGSGVRYAIKPDDRLNLRLDYGMAAHSRGIYLTIAEAF